MADLTSDDAAVREARETEGKTVNAFVKREISAEELTLAQLTAEGRSPVVERVAAVPEPAFWGARVFKDYKLGEIFPYINETALFKNQWQLKTAAQGDYLRLVEEKYRPILGELEEEVKAAGWFEPKSIIGFYPARATATIWSSSTPKTRSANWSASHSAPGAGPAVVDRGFF